MKLDLAFDPSTFVTARAATVFAAMALGDVLWALYVRRTGQGSPHQSAAFAVALWLVGVFVAASWMQNLLYVPFAAVGAYAGTYLAVRLDADKKA